MKGIRYINSKLGLRSGDSLSAGALFDPIQTHALYGVIEGDLLNYKAKLQRLGSYKFRIVKGKCGFVTICFRLKYYKVVDTRFPQKEVFEGFLKECEEYVEDNNNSQALKALEIVEK